MSKITPAVALKMSIFDLAKKFGWSIHVIDNMTEMVDDRFIWCEKCQRSKPKKWKGCVGMLGVRVDCFSKKIILKDILTAFEAGYDKISHAQSQYCKGLVLKSLCNIGFTRLDSVALPQSTIKIEDLKKLSREKLLLLDARLLGTISENVTFKNRIRHDRHFKEYFLAPPTVGDVISGSYYSDSRGLTKKTENKTREVLAQLGFGYEDGPFMQPIDKHRFLIEDLVKNDEICDKDARLVVRIAEKRGWVKF